MSNHSNRASPTRLYRRPVGMETTTGSNGVDISILPTSAYRGNREQGKSPIGNAPPASPRLRNSRERQPLQPSPSHGSCASVTYDEHGHFLENSFESHHDASANIQEPPISVTSPSYVIHNHSPQQPYEDHQNPSSSYPQRLSVQTSRLPLPPVQQPSSATTDFEESPILGIPGSFVLTPPTAHQETTPQLLQPAVFQPAAQENAPKSPEIEESELGVRESIPIMLGDDDQSQPWQSGPDEVNISLQALTYGYPRDQGDYMMGGTQPISHHDLGDSPIDPFGSRDSLRPEDSASIAPYRAAGPLTFDSETYSVVNAVLNMYHNSPAITSEFASASRDKVQQVSPAIAQYRDWGSKEATETYLARLLSDANVSGEEDSRAQEGIPTMAHPVLNLPHLEDNTQGPEAGGTAIIYPPQSRRYSRGSRGSTTTTIQDDASRSDSSLGNRSQDHFLHSKSTGRTSNVIELPQLAWTNGGLGLSYHEDFTPPSPSSHQDPPRPAYSPPPPPPPVKPHNDEHTTLFDASQMPLIRKKKSRTLAAQEQTRLEYDSMPADHHRQMEQHEQHEQQFQFESHDQHHLSEFQEQHPARALTPVYQRPEESIEALYGAPQPIEKDEQTPTLAEATEQDPPDPAKQALIKRYRILEELLTTEHQFCIDMMIAHNIFEATAVSLMTDKEKKILFSNCKELEKFSLSLFRAFKKAAKPIVNYDIPPPTGPWNRDSSDAKSSHPPDTPQKLRRPSQDSQNQFSNCTLENDHKTTVGQVFLENKEKMERLYTTYYLNQENAAGYVKKNQANPELQGWVSACFEQVENMTQAWDLDSLLVKPCQRLLKYPLLLDQLISSSDPDHPDLEDLRAARIELMAMSGRINEAKKRADTFRAATSEGKKEKTKGKGIGKSIVKAFIPKTDKNKAYDEADKTFKDQDYKSVEQKFGGHFFQLQIVIRDFEQYMDAMMEHYQQINIICLGFISVSEVGPSVLPELESTWRKWAIAHYELMQKGYEDHKVAVRNRVLKPIGDLWEMWVAYQKTIEQRKRYLLPYVKHKQLTEKGDKVDPELEEAAKKFSTINDTLKHELPLLYERTKVIMRTLMTLFMFLQKDWYKTCSKKILPLLESEPQHTTSIRYDLDSYVDRFNLDFKVVLELANKFGIVNRGLLVEVSNMTSPVPTISSDGGGSSRNSSSRRTESMGSEASLLDSRQRNSGGGYTGGTSRAQLYNQPRSSPTGPAYPSLYPPGPSGRSPHGPTSLREARALSPVSDHSESTVVHQNERRNTGPSRNPYMGLDGAVDIDNQSPLGSASFDFPPQLGASFLAPTSQPMVHSMSAPSHHSVSLPGSQRASGVFNSALPMSDSPVRASPEVLFLAASLFEFNIAHDRREGGIPYLVYVPGEIFDVIGMKGELWLARNQDDPTKTVGWIWEKHFARILPEDA
ncbi:hypothetical protein GQ44DRAFT_698846 [Phaeosphaeriaceae sp. PMI808]|nr:hypothetical protein GQ44DRAFT_698846 [Phaeosphaeriaceae sp. PMI808]